MPTIAVLQVLFLATAGALRRLQSATTLTVGDLVNAITATLPGVKTAKLVLLETGQSPTAPPLFNGLNPELLPNALGAPLPPPPVNVTVRVYDAVCEDSWVSRHSPLNKAAWATNLTAELGGEPPSRLAA